MATNQDLLDAVAAKKTDVDNQTALVLQLIAEVNNLIARFLAKLAAGNDTQPAIDLINSISLTDSIQQIQSAIDQVKIEGQ